MAKHTLIDTDDSLDGEIVFFYTQSGKTFEADRENILTWIDETQLNEYNTGYGLCSDPHSRDEIVTVDAETYYLENTEEVNESYFKHVINK